MPMQRSFEDLGTPLAQVTFCVLDLETTGGSPADCAITEIGACKVQMGEVVGTFQTLVNPGRPVPAFIRLLTGLSEEVLVHAPDVEAVLPSFLEFVKGSVLVAHNARFDLAFIRAALERASYPPLENRIVDTATLARKILAGEVPNHKLETLARHLRCAHRPTHRAYADVLATIDVLHHLIERVAGFGVTTLEDLVAMSTSRIDGTFSKISLTDELPNAGGIYRFLSGTGETLYVGKAVDLRSRVRSYFYGDPRRKIRDLLRQVEHISVDTFETMLEAEVAEVRAIATERPPHNRAGKRTATWYLKVHSAAKTPKLSTARVPRDDGHFYLGPFASIRVAKTLIEALQDSARVHRCAEPSRCRGCAFSEMDRCAGTDASEHARAIQVVEQALIADPEPLFVALEAKIARLAASERFEEAAEVRDRASALEQALAGHVAVKTLVDAGDILLRIGSRVVLVRRGRLAGAVTVAQEADLGAATARLREEAPVEQTETFVRDTVMREAKVISSWIARHAGSCRMIDVSDTWSVPAHAGRLGTRFKQRESSGGVRHPDQRPQRAVGRA